MNFIKNKRFLGVLTIILVVFASVYLFLQSNSPALVASTVINHTSVSQFSSLTSQQIQAAAALRLMMRHASVGSNINTGLDELEAGNAIYDRSLWSFQNRGNPGWQQKVDDLDTQVAANYGSYDVMTMKFCYIDNSTDAATIWNYYRTHMEALMTAYPSKVFVWWTMPIMTTGDAIRDAFNTSVRSYASTHDIILFDIAAIESHDPAGNPITNGGYEAMYSNYSSDGGHLNETGYDRMAQAYWVLMATIAGVDDTTAPTISAVSSGTPSTTGATITWTTDENASSRVEYGLTTSYGTLTSETDIAPRVMSHSVPLSGLTAGTTYHYRVISTDGSTNTATSGDYSFTTAASDTTAPTISAVSSGTPSATGATITWTTNENASSRVEYGLTTSYGTLTSETDTAPRVTSHSVPLTGLTSQTTYHYRVISTDGSTNTATSGDYTFITADNTAPTLSSINATPSTTSVTIIWTTNENASSRVEYGLDTSYGILTVETDTAPRVTSHSVSFSGLTGETTYHYRVISTDAATNTATSSDQNFTTTSSGFVNIYRSVAPGATAELTSGTSNSVSIAGSVATFNSSLPATVGIGDVIEYDSDGNNSIDAIAFIHGITDATHYVVKAASGGTPTAATSDTDWKIFRAYTSLSLAENGTENTGIDNAVRDFDTWSGGYDLVSNNAIWHLVVYPNGTNVDSTTVTLADWTTGTNNYLKIETLGSGRNNTGVWSESYYRLSITNDDGINIQIPNVWIDGLQVYVSSSGFAEINIIAQNLSGSGWIRISNNILTGTHTSGSVTYNSGIEINDANITASYIWNNIVYNFTGHERSCGIWIHSGTDHYIYNNTVYNTRVGIMNGAHDSFGSAGAFGQVYVKNNIVKDPEAGGYSYGGVFNSDSGYNLATNVPDTYMAQGVAADSGTTDSVSTSRLIQSGQNFLSTVEAGMVVRNTTDSTFSYVTYVDNNTQLTLNDDIMASGESFTIYTNKVGIVSFVDQSNGNFHLSGVNPYVINQGLDLSADAGLSFSTDIEGDNRVAGLWDIGADELSDSTAPTDGSITYTNGYITSASVALTVDDGSDSVSGIDTTSRLVQRRMATLSSGSCGSYGSFAVISPSGTYPTLSDTTVVSGNCYQYQYLVSDNSENQATYTSSNTVRVDTATPTGGSLSYTDGYSVSSVSLTAADGTDAASGIDTATRIYQRRSATFSGGVCGSYGSFSTITPSGSYPNLVDNSIATDTCYQYQFLVSDAAGNEATYTSSNTVRVDATAPTGGSIAYTAGNYTEATIPLLVDDGTDAISDIDTDSRTVQRRAAVLTNGTCGTYGSFATVTTTGTYPNLVDNSVISNNCYQYQYVVADNAGNSVTYTSTDVILVDTAGPTIPGIPSTSTPTADTTPTWLWTISTDSASGLHDSEPYTLEWCQDPTFVGCGSNSVVANSNTFTHATALSEGTWYVRVKSKDRLSNESDYSEVGSVVIDTTNSLGSITINQGDMYTTNTTVTLALSASDTGSAVTSMQLSESDSYSGTDWQTYATTASFSLNTTAGIHTVYVRFRDAAGNISDSYSDSIILDTEEPVSTGVVINSSDAYVQGHTVTITLPATDTGSELTEVIICENSSFSGCSWQDYNDSVDLELSSGDGVKTVYIKFQDQAGNESEVYSDTITVDTVMQMQMTQLSNRTFNSGTSRVETTLNRPTFRGTAEVGSTITITIHSEVIQGQATADASGNWSWTPDTDIPAGDHEVLISGQDAAGNTSSISFVLGINTSTELPDTGITLAIGFGLIAVLSGVVLRAKLLKR